MSKKQIGLYHSDTHSFDPADYGRGPDVEYALEKSDPETYLTVPVEIDGEMWNVPCGLIFCEVCESCMACSDPDCLGGGSHAWPEGWQELAERMDD